MNKYDTLISKSNEMIDLLKELQISNEAEGYRYILKHEFKLGSEEVFSLLDNETQKLKIDRLENIESWLKIRNVSSDKVYRVK